MDGLPTHICDQCYTQINDFINFRKICILSDETFRQKVRFLTFSKITLFQDKILNKFQTDIKNDILSKGVKLESMEICEIKSPRKTLERTVLFLFPMIFFPNMKIF